MPPRVIRETKVSRVFREKLVHRVKLEPRARRERPELQVQQEPLEQMVFQSSGSEALQVHLPIRADSMLTTTPRQAALTSTPEQHGICWLRRVLRENKDLRENRVRQEQQALQSHGRAVLILHRIIQVFIGHTMTPLTDARTSMTERSGHFLQPRELKENRVFKARLEQQDHKVRLELRARRERLAQLVPPEQQEQTASP